VVPLFRRGRTACGADRRQNVSGRFFRRCGYQLFRFLEPTTGWVLLSGAEQATFTDTFDAAFTTPSSPYPTAMRAPRADAFAGTLDPRARMPGPGTT
jgi:hypothetical protein